MFRSIFLCFLLFTLAKEGASAHNGLLVEHDSGVQLTQLLRQRQLQTNDLPDICSAYEQIIDQIPNGRDSCNCDGLSVHCLFRAVCPEGTNDPRCLDAVMYEVRFENQQLTVLSCASLSEGNFLETCAKVSLGPDLMLDQCLLGSYGGQPCDCHVCDDRSGLSLDCSMYDPRAVTNCSSMALGQVTPMVDGFNQTAAVPKDLPATTDSKSGAGQVNVAISVSAVLILIAAVF